MSTRPANVDHLVYAGPNLEEGIARVEALLGVAPMAGGRHPSYGTHNALVSLGASTYLEILAPDPRADPPERGCPLGVRSAKVGWRLSTWALRTEAIERSAAAAPLVGKVEAGRRTRADGTELAWRLTDPYAMPLQGAVPFLISWGSTPHPSGSAPSAGTLTGLRIEHPDPAAVRGVLEALGAPVPVDRADAFALVATIESMRGTVELR